MKIKRDDADETSQVFRTTKNRVERLIGNYKKRYFDRNPDTQ